ncbi:MAG TPA: nucleotidyltransferase family protein [Ferruginibacter sp.]|nr:nucleotidyltransferase family protein [Ferruginibacter sp.]HMP22406.1 nucleotidyltransferase family protein [Ferruginibacter sp.]
MEAIILAGGLGTRLRSVVSDLPKCMAPVAGRPFLQYIIRHLQQQGVTSFIFSVGYLYEAIESFLQKEYPSINYQLSIETSPLGTGGAIQLACAKTTAENVLVVNGDTMFSINVHRLMTAQLNKPAACTLALKPMQHFNRYGVVQLNSNSCITAFEEKKYYAEGLINGGVYALNTKALLQKKLPEKFSFEKDYLEQFVHEGHFYGLPQDDYFIDIGIPEDYEKAQQQFAGFDF